MRPIEAGRFVIVRVTWRDEVDALVRGASGGLLFGIPLLYTMELWEIGGSASPANLAAVLLITCLVVVVLIQVAGFRRSADVYWTDVLTDAVKAVAIGLVCTAGVLVLLGEIETSTSMREAVGKVVYEAAPFCLGVAVARHVFRQGRDEGEGGTEPEQVHPTFADLGATAIGALFLSANIAPTEEIPMRTASLGPVGLLAVMAASLLVSYAIVYEAGFGDEDKRRQQIGVLQHPATETAVAYVVALGVSGLMLFFFGGLADAPPSWALGQVVVLGLPAALGGAAGRLAI